MASNAERSITIVEYSVLGVSMDFVGRPRVEIRRFCAGQGDFMNALAPKLSLPIGVSQTIPEGLEINFRDGAVPSRLD